MDSIENQFRTVRHRPSQTVVAGRALHCRLSPIKDFAQRLESRKLPEGFEDELQLRYAAATTLRTFLSTYKAAHSGINADSGEMMEKLVQQKRDAQARLPKLVDEVKASLDMLGGTDPGMDLHIAQVKQELESALAHVRIPTTQCR